MEPQAEAQLVEEYLKLVDQFGPKSPQVLAFEERHKADPGAVALFSTVWDLDRSGRRAWWKQKAIILAAVLLFLALPLGIGVWAGVSGMESSLAEAKRESTQFREDWAILRDKHDRLHGDYAKLAKLVKQQEEEIGHYAVAKKEIEQLHRALAEVRASWGKSEQQVAELLVEKKKLNAEVLALREEVKLYANAKTEIDRLKDAFEQESVARKKSEKRTDELLVEKAKLTADVRALRQEIDSYADSKKEITRLQVALGKEKLAREKSEKQATNLLAEKGRLKDDLKQENGKRLQAETALADARAAHKRLQDGWRTASNRAYTEQLIYWASQLRNEPLWGSDYGKLNPPPNIDKMEGEHYLLALWRERRGEEGKYRDELRQVPQKDRWHDLATMELRALEGDPGSMVAWLGKLEKQIRTSKAFLPTNLLIQRAVGQQAALRLHQKVKPMMPALLNGAASKDMDTRKAAIATLGHIGPRAAEAVKILLDALRDPSPAVRWEAASTLGQIGPSANNALLTLGELVRRGDKDRSVQIAVERAIFRIDPRGLKSSPFEMKK